MDQIRLGATGLHVSRVCLGMMSYGNDSDRPWVLDEAAAEPIIRRAVEGGITFFDTEAGRCRSAYGSARGVYP
jgi:1-deoxyxylulose-5-phosphate synthase